MGHGKEDAVDTMLNNKVIIL